MVNHWPFQLGYLASSAACASPIATISAATNASAHVKRRYKAELRYNMIVLPALSGSVLIAMDTLRTGSDGSRDLSVRAWDADQRRDERGGTNQPTHVVLPGSQHRQE